MCVGGGEREEGRGGKGEGGLVCGCGLWEAGVCVVCACFFFNAHTKHAHTKDAHL